MIMNAKPTTQRTKHINIRYFAVRERTEEFQIQIQHLGTNEMIADILTKPLQSALFANLRSKLLNSRDR
jgi:hypothetical protein